MVVGLCWFDLLLSMMWFSVLVVVCVVVLVGGLIWVGVCSWLLFSMMLL